jgi:hypothetical protein
MLNSTAQTLPPPTGALLAGVRGSRTQVESVLRAVRSAQDAADETHAPGQAEDRAQVVVEDLRIGGEVSHDYVDRHTHDLGVVAAIDKPRGAENLIVLPFALLVVERVPVLELLTLVLRGGSRDSSGSLGGRTSLRRRSAIKLWLLPTASERG